MLFELGKIWRLLFYLFIFCSVLILLKLLFSVEEKYIAQNITWIPCQDFTIELGMKQIEEYISTWEFHESWLHCTDFLNEEEVEFSKLYHYRTRWSIPTRRKPIPRATACVYFTIQISKVKPLVCTFTLITQQGKVRYPLTLCCLPIA
ncbi:hypothetical protein XENTR_v10020998 [Xenopus tropicalis]|nr:hypothetical protein XENTR_v10020998 [Xenopus tropicalis]